MHSHVFPFISSLSSAHRNHREGTLESTKKVSKVGPEVTSSMLYLELTKHPFTSQALKASFPTAFLPISNPNVKNKLQYT